MSCGTPFVATRVGGIPEVAGGGVGQLVPPGDAGAFADGMKQMLARPRSEVPVGGFRPSTWDDSARAFAEYLERHVGTRQFVHRRAA
jgi:glycosyltransferase involved in cell wall biosynthesis